MRVELGLAESVSEASTVMVCRERETSREWLRCIVGVSDGVSDTDNEARDRLSASEDDDV